MNLCGAIIEKWLYKPLKMTIRVTHVYATVSLKTIRWITIPPKGR